MKTENVKAQMRKGVLEFCILSILSRDDAYASDIIAEMISDNAEYREFIRKDYLNHGLLVAKATKKPMRKKVYMKCIMNSVS